MERIPIYFVPGLATSPTIFDSLSLDSKKYTFHYIHWIHPIDIHETLADYALRLSAVIKHENPVLIGVSFGGILVQELANIINTRKVIIISSIKSEKEFPKKLKMARVTKAYTLFPTIVIEKFETYTKYFIGSSLKRKVVLYNKYLAIRNKNYLKWAIAALINWKQIKPIENIVHIHGTKDPIFPIKNISNCTEILEGTHVIILTKAKKISAIIDAALTC
jgi:pimeloyl-ACP methyl ester carboxylesterase